MERERQRDTIAAWETFLSSSLDTLLERHRQTPPEQQALALFRTVAATVPAYRAFLAEQGLDPASIRSYDDFRNLPRLTKENYLLRYPLPDLCRNGKLESCDMIAVSSGSTGKPCFWPRFLTDELQIATRFEQVFHDSFSGDKRRTLAVICFTLGTWVGGMYTASCCRHLAAKGYPITTITPGNNREEIFRVVQELGPHYEQVVLLGYPPFLKGIIDEGLARGVEWRRYNIKMVLAGEVFSEEWRALVGERVGSTNPSCDSASLYGTADAGVLGNETPLSIGIRRFLAENPAAARQLCGESRLPTLVQYDPMSRFFEQEDGALLFSGDNGIPLLRYNILDTGGIIPYDAMLTFLADWGFDPKAEMGIGCWVSGVGEQETEGEKGKRGEGEEQGQGARGKGQGETQLPNYPITQLPNYPTTQHPTPNTRPLPFVYVFGRSDFTVSYFGANIFPENVTVGLEQPDIKEWVTGKFVLQVKEDDDRNRFLSVVVELAPGVQSDEEKRQAIANSIRAHLLRLNSEFAHYVPEAQQKPQVTLAPAGDPEYFPAGVKHRYTRR